MQQVILMIPFNYHGHYIVPLTEKSLSWTVSKATRCMYYYIFKVFIKVTLEM